MNTLSEIKAAIEHLPPLQQAALLAFLTRRVKMPETVTPGPDAHLTVVIGAFSGVHEATGRKAE
ncbi:MAG: hypothetical protein P4L99_11965 [Chthoniobacter sp.]|nr:hypothetical protein [Chthoniobacter sp.]